MPSNTNLELATADSPFYSDRTDPVYARRIRTFRSDWNLYEYCALYPVFTSRMHRILNVINQPVDLFPVFSESDAENDSFMM